MKEEGNAKDQDNAAKAIRFLKLIDSAIILITNATMRTSEELSAHTTRYYIRVMLYGIMA
jgi:ribonucleotide monophosphatase NagD (HAD superfamily)